MAVPSAICIRFLGPFGMFFCLECFRHLPDLKHVHVKINSLDLNRINMDFFSVAPVSHYVVGKFLNN